MLPLFFLHTESCYCAYITDLNECRFSHRILARTRTCDVCCALIRQVILLFVNINHPFYNFWCILEAVNKSCYAPNTSSLFTAYEQCTSSNNEIIYLFKNFQ